jgi:hypothetical protein
MVIAPHPGFLKLYLCCYRGTVKGKVNNFWHGSG